MKYEAWGMPSLRLEESKQEAYPDLDEMTKRLEGVYENAARLDGRVIANFVLTCRTPQSGDAVVDQASDEFVFFMVELPDSAPSPSEDLEAQEATPPTRT